MKKKRRLARKLLLLFFSLLVCLLLIEGASRLLLGGDYPMGGESPAAVKDRFLREKFSSRMLRRHDDPALCYELIPGGRASILNQRYSVNSQGLRGEEPAMPRPEETLRIAVAGDSFVFGWGVDDADTLPAAMERILKKGGLGHRDFETLNSGVPGFNVAQMKEYLLRKTLPLKPDLLVLVVSANDIVADYLHFDPLFQGLYTDFLPLPYGMKPFLWRTLVSYRFLVQRYKRMAEGSGRVGKFTEREVAFFGEQVRAILALGEERGIPVLPVILPMLEDFSSYPYAKQHEDMHRVLEGIDYVDLLPRMSGYDVEPLWFLPDDHHLNAKANRAVARMVVSELQGRGWIKLRPRHPAGRALGRSALWPGRPRGGGYGRRSGRPGRPSRRDLPGGSHERRDDPGVGRSRLPRTRRAGAGRGGESPGPRRPGRPRG